MNLCLYLISLCFFIPTCLSFSSQQKSCRYSMHLSATSTESQIQAIEKSVDQLKKILAREYISFFSPMFKEYYSPKVTFDDPFNSFEGLSSYEKNVDMLAGRTMLGSFLFSDAGIALHSVTGGEVSVDENDETVVKFSEIITRWTLRVTASVLPWKPTARFTGISVYNLQLTSNVKDSTSAGESPLVQITSQQDYWDSINIRPDKSGTYAKAGFSKGLFDFLDQVKPGGFEAQQSAPELPYELLRRGDGYEVRRYPEYGSVSLPYTRRDEGYGALGAFTRAMNPLAPALLSVPDSSDDSKTMSWPLVYAGPNSPSVSSLIPKEATEKAGQGQWRTISIKTEPSKVIAVGFFNDASLEPVVRLANAKLKECLTRDGLRWAEQSENSLCFAQFDAIFSLGKRRGEVWIELEEGGHPW